MCDREPSIHITSKNLKSILEDVLSLELSSDDLNLIMSKSRKVSLDNRIVISSSDKIEKKINTITKSTKGDTELLADIIYSLRKKLKHRGISRIKQNTTDWTNLKNLSEVCINFSNDFELDKRKGFIVYCEIGLNKISSFRNYISKLVQMSESISNEYESIYVIDNDDNKELTSELHNIYTSFVSKYTGIIQDFSDNPSIYVNFCKLSKLLTTELKNIKPEIYIKSQFEGLIWTDSYPEPYQLVTDKAITRLNKYLYENNINTDNKKAIISNKLKRLS